MVSELFIFRSADLKAESSADFRATLHGDDCFWRDPACYVRSSACE
jgi:hypothetical protein